MGYNVKMPSYRGEGSNSPKKSVIDIRTVPNELQMIECFQYSDVTLSMHDGSLTWYNRYRNIILA